jgi:hypothetical protein
MTGNNEKETDEFFSSKKSHNTQLLVKNKSAPVSAHVHKQSFHSCERNIFAVFLNFFLSTQHSRPNMSVLLHLSAHYAQLVRNQAVLRTRLTTPTTEGSSACVRHHFRSSDVICARRLFKTLIDPFKFESV